MNLSLSTLWELPQNALGVLVLGAVKLGGQAREVSRDQGRWFVRTESLGISLGLFVFWSRGGNRWFRADPLMKRHEHGHTFQSRRLGPLYLPLVGVPSVLRVLYAMTYRELTGRKWRGYYAGYPERGADRLGGITRAERTAQLDRED
jgi:hypothetical protein